MCRLRYFVNFEKEKRTLASRKRGEQLAVGITLQAEIQGRTGRMPRHPG